MLPSPCVHQSRSDVSAQGEHSWPEASPLAPWPFPPCERGGKGMERKAYLWNGKQMHEERAQSTELSMARAGF